MIDFKLANVLVELDDFTEDHVDIFYRASGATSPDVETHALSFEGNIDFFTYFNAISWCKWTKYASIDNLWLHLELCGDAVKTTQRSAKLADKHSEPDGILIDVPASLDFKTFDVQLKTEEEVALIAFALETDGKAFLRNAYYYTKVDETRIRNVKLALATTTFKKEEYILRNIDEIKSRIFASNEPLAGHFHMFVVDNGRTLDANSISDGNVTVIPNANVGGSGGFACGMMAALDIDATHVLLMDDDVRVMPESFIRTFNLLSLRNDQYADAFLNGAMLSLEEPNLHFEDVAHVREDAVYARIKDDLYIDRETDIIENESINVEVKNAYGAWWYSCIPTSAVRKFGLPLPVFVRCDDVEYGIRCQPTYMCMNGICVWHASFEGRFRASVDCYQYIRNFMIMMAMDDVSSESLFMVRLYRVFRAYLRALDYSSAELILDGLEDYLKGPEYLASASGEQLIKKNGAKNEKLIPLEEIDRDLLSEINLADGNPPKNRSLLTKLIETLPYDRHLLPDALLKDQPAAVYYHFGAYPGSHTARRKTMVAVDLDQTHGHVRRMDKERWAKLNERYHTLKKDYEARGSQVREAYKEAKPWLTSREFWEGYLKHNLENS